MKEKFKLTSLERKWVMYDVGNSAFTLMVSTLIPIYFNMLASETVLDSVTYLAYWGYAITVSTLIVVVLGPVLGAISDKKGRKKPIFIAVILLGAAGCLSMGFTKGWKSFLIVFVIARVFYQISLIIYDSMLGDVTTEDRLDEVSSQGYAWGYIGSVVPFIICLVLFIFSGKLGMTQAQALAVAFVITAVWWASVSVPLFRSYEQKNYVNERESHENLFVQLWATLKDMAKTPQILLFVLAFFFYIDGVYTIIDMSTAYGAALGLDSTGLLLALLVTQFVAFPSVLIIGRLSRTVAGETDHGLHHRLFRHRDVRGLHVRPDPLLDPRGVRWHFPGRHPGPVALLFYEDHPLREVRRVFRLPRYLRQGRFHHGHAGHERPHPDHRKAADRRRRHRLLLHRGPRPLPDVRREGRQETVSNMVSFSI